MCIERSGYIIPVSLNPYAIVIDEDQERVGQERKVWQRSTPSYTHAMAKDEASERSDIQKDTSAQSTGRVSGPRCTKCTKTP